LKKRLLKIFIIIICLLVALEIGLRVKFSHRADDEFCFVTQTSSGKSLSVSPGNLVITPDPFTTFRFKPDQQFRNCRINRWGLRARDFEKEKPEGVYRIIVTGGSAAFGLNIYDDEKMFDRLLEEKLNSGSDRVYEVINAGAVTYTSAMELSLYIHRLAEFEPDMIISLTGWNDFYMPHIFPHNDPYNTQFHMRVEQMLERNALQVATSRSLALATIRKEFNRILMQFNILKSGGGSAAWKHRQESIDFFERNMRNYAAAARGGGTDMLIALQPEESQRSNPCENETNDLKYSRGEKYIQAVNETYDSLREVSAAIAADFDNTYYADLTDVFDDVDGCVWFDWVHFNESGHAAVADRLYEVVSGINAAESP